MNYPLPDRWEAHGGDEGIWYAYIKNQWRYEISMWYIGDNENEYFLEIVYYDNHDDAILLHLGPCANSYENAIQKVRQIMNDNGLLQNYIMRSLL